jgi:cation transport regulator ChaC
MTDALNDTFLYFAYGSNMFTRRLKERTPSAVAIGTGFVRGHRLTFDKVSGSGEARSGKCHIERTDNPTDLVHGVLFRIKTAEEGDLDKAEGIGEGYKKDRTIQVVTPYCTVQAVGYLATNKDSTLRPYDWYKAFVVAGAVEHRLPNGYVEWLRTVASQPDPKADRRAKNEALLFDS